MFKTYKDLCDVVSVFIYCPADHTFLLIKDGSGEYWMPCGKTEKLSWKATAYKVFFDIFGSEPVATACTPIRIYKVWLPLHQLSSVFHAIYKISIKSDVKKKMKIKATARNKISWFNTVELERQRVHANLKSPELTIYMQMALGDVNKEDSIWTEFDINGVLIEVTEDGIVVTTEAGPSAGTPTGNVQLLQAANYHRDDQIRLYREFISLSFPAFYMSPQLFSAFMTDLGWQRQHCTGLFRAADVNGRGGLSFQDLLLWCAAIEPATQHGGQVAEIRCRYIFRLYDCNHDGKLEYEEFKELMAAARDARSLSIDALSVAKDADTCLRQMGFQPNTQLQLQDFLKAVAELRLRGTSSMIRSPRSIAGYLSDLQERNTLISTQSKGQIAHPAPSSAAPDTSASQRLAVKPDYSVATFTVRVRKEAANEMIELQHFNEDAVSPSTVRVLEMPGANMTSSNEVLGPSTYPVEAMAAVQYFATAIERPVPSQRRGSVATNSSVGLNNKSAWSWANPSEEIVMGNLLLKLAEGVKVICQSEPRLLRLNSPVYVVGDLHGNLGALLSIEAALWPSGAALSPAKLLFLGDFVDRGPHGTELMAYLMASKLQRPQGVYLIRGNHETRDIQKMFTFHTECITKYGEVEGSKIWNVINQVYDVLPLAAVVDDKVFCCHGGIPPPWVCPLISAIDKIPVPLVRPAEQSTIAWELLWNDPVKPNKMTATLTLELTANEGFAANVRRGTGHVFDQTAIDRFLLANQLSHVVRAHEMHPTGFLCQLRGRLISVFSSSHYCGGNNDSGVVLLEGNKLRYGLNSYEENFLNCDGQEEYCNLVKVSLNGFDICLQVYRVF